MGNVPDKIQTWQMVQPATRNKETQEVIPGKIEKKELAQTSSELSALKTLVSDLQKEFTDLKK